MALKQGEFIVEVDRSDGSRLGIDCELAMMPFEVRKLDSAGLVDRWNCRSASHQVEIGDKIVGVNGQGDKIACKEELKKHAFLRITFQKANGAPQETSPTDPAPTGGHWAMPSGVAMPLDSGKCTYCAGTGIDFRMQTCRCAAGRRKEAERTRRQVRFRTSPWDDDASSDSDSPRVQRQCSAEVQSLSSEITFGVNPRPKSIRAKVQSIRAKVQLTAPEDGEFIVELDRSDGSPLGIDAELAKMPFEIRKVCSGGLVDGWNSRSSAHKVETGDTIVGVNDRADKDGCKDELKKHACLRIIFQKAGALGKGLAMIHRMRSAAVPLADGNCEHCAGKGVDFRMQPCRCVETSKACGRT